MLGLISNSTLDSAVARDQILVCSPDVSLLNDLADIKGYQLIHAKTNQETLAKIKDLTLSLVILDLDHMGIDGICVARAIRNHPQSGHVPMIIIYSAAPLPLKAIDNCEGCIDFIAKPYDPELLKWKINHFLKFPSYLDQIKQKIANQENDDSQNHSEFIRINSLNISNQLASIVAHEVKNPMTTMRALLELAKLSTKPMSSDRIDVLIKELARINTILTNFLSISKNQKSDKGQQQLENIIKEMQYLLDAKAIQERKTIIYHLSPCPPITVSSHEITQIILNLALNGLEAMEAKKGILTIITNHNEKHVQLIIADEGRGIDQELLKHIWEPFYTTKSSGSGLGLAICRTLAERNDAEIAVKSDSAGTTFTVSFPIKD